MFPGKLDLYVGAAGFHPGKVLPCVIDVGTDNTDLQNNDLYMGAPSLECLQDNNAAISSLCASALCVLPAALLLGEHRGIA